MELVTVQRDLTQYNGASYSTEGYNTIQWASCSTEGYNTIQCRNCSSNNT